jgi:hypothetical protein
MIELEMKRLTVTNKGERKIKHRKITGKVNDMDRPAKGLRSPLVAIKKFQKKPTMLLIEPTNNPNAKGSLHPALTGMVENILLGEKITDLSVCFIPPHSPSCKRLSHGVACLFSVFAFSSSFRYSNLFPQFGHLIHLTLGGIFSRGMLFV